MPRAGASFIAKLANSAIAPICTRMVDASPLAIKHMGADGRIQVIMNPDPTREMQEGEELVVLAEDDDTYEVGDDVSNELDVGELPTLQEPPKNLEDILIVGWRRDIREKRIPQWRAQNRSLKNLVLQSRGVRSFSLHNYFALTRREVSLQELQIR